MSTLSDSRNEVGLCVMAVEAKVNEDFGPLVGERRKEASQGQSDRLEYLRQLLGIPSLPDSIRYQLLHRTAAALLTARLFHAGTAVMLVQAWGDKATVRGDFDRFCELLSARKIGAGVYSIPTAAAPTLFLAWCQGDPKFLQVELPPYFAGPATGV